MTINDKIKQRLDEYLGFDSTDLFKYADLMLVFGGCLRDIIANQKIHDIDIICGPESCKALHDFLNFNGYTYMENLTPKDLASVYSNIHIINEPHTFVKGDRVVQLIRPTIQYSQSNSNEKCYRDSLSSLVFEVDLSCCGLSDNGETLIENVRNAVLHCRKRVFEVRSTRMNNPQRIHHRIGKLEDRGWESIKSSQAMVRDSKIESLFDGDTTDYSFECIYSPDKDLAFDRVKPFRLPSPF